ncbi:MAG: hypothetical protein ABJE66_13180 [Deltaproteobacteria bacterium]
MDGAADASPAAKDQLAAAVAAHYGLPVADLQARIASGRFRVKGNCDRATADSYIRDLTALGARCSLEEASPSNAAKTPLPFPAVSVAPAQPPARPSQGVLPPRQTPSPATARTATPPKGFQSGLAAAFSGEQQVGSLGALDDGALLKLSSVDGKEEGPAADAFAPPPTAPAATLDGKAKPAPAKSAGPAAKPKDEPLDMFAPPDADDANFAVDLAPDEVARAAKKRVGVPPETEPAEPAPRISRPALQLPTDRASRPSLQTMTGPPATGLRDPKTRFVVGIVIAIVLGFVPAHFIAHLQESSAFAQIDANVNAVQHDAVTPEDYTALDGFRAGQLARKHDERRNIALLAMLIWAAGGAGIAYVWFRRIPWDRDTRVVT